MHFLSSHWSLLSSILTFSLVFIEMYLTYRHEYRPHVPSLKYLYTIKEYLCICHPDPEIEPYQNPWVSPSPRINILVHCPASWRKAALLQEPKVAFLCDTEWSCFVPHLVVIDWNLSSNIRNKKSIFYFHCLYSALHWSSNQSVKQGKELKNVQSGKETVPVIIDGMMICV